MGAVEVTDSQGNATGRLVTDGLGDGTGNYCIQPLHQYSLFAHSLKRDLPAVSLVHASIAPALGPIAVNTTIC